MLGYGGKFDYDTNQLRPSDPLIEARHPLRDRVARWAGLAPEQVAHALVAEYRPGTPLGWHRDVPDFEQVYGVSLGSDAVIRFRPYPPEIAKRADTGQARRRGTLDLSLRGSGALAVAAERATSQGAALVDHLPHAGRAAGRPRVASASDSADGRCAAARPEDGATHNEGD